MQYQYTSTTGVRVLEKRKPNIHATHPPTPHPMLTYIHPRVHVYVLETGIAMFNSMEPLSLFVDNKYTCTLAYTCSLVYARVCKFVKWQ